MLEILSHSRQRRIFFALYVPRGFNDGVNEANREIGHFATAQIYFDSPAFANCTFCKKFAQTALILLNKK
jgi:hypothetical protein